LRCQPEARHQPREIPGDRRQSGFVEIVDVEIGEAIVPLVAAEILQMEIAADPGGRGVVERRPLRPVLVEEMACPPEEREGVGGHGFEFEIQALRLAALIERGDPLDNTPVGHRRIPSRNNSRKSRPWRSEYCSVIPLYIDDKTNVALCLPGIAPAARRRAMA